MAQLLKSFMLITGEMLGTAQDLLVSGMRRCPKAGRHRIILKTTQSKNHLQQQEVALRHETELIVDQGIKFLQTSPMENLWY